MPGSYGNLPKKKVPSRKEIDNLVKTAPHLKPNDWESEVVAHDAIAAKESYKFPSFKEFSQILDENLGAQLGLMAAGPAIGALRPFTKLGAPPVVDTVASIGVPLAGMGYMANAAKKEQEKQLAMQSGYCNPKAGDSCSDTDIKRAKSAQQQQQQAKINQAWQQNPQKT
tara:strand:+ start:12713 stop:13219 length:507 start_codon:yes stop_codon:yes gene_type:complete